jgi:polysaccharide chain length determinant protein (PEP-CTERM system associated)
MIENRELSMDDYLAMLRRRIKVILIPALLAPLVGFLISYAFPAKYTSQSLVLVEEQKVPEGYVKPVVTEDLMQRIATVQQRVLAPSRLQPALQNLSAAKNRNVSELADDVRANLSIEPVVTDLNQAAAKKPKKPGQGSDVPGFTVNYTARNPREAQEICEAVTSLMIEENLKSREQVAQSTTEFLTRQLEEKKKGLDEQDSKLAAFKRQYMGQLPGDVDNNLKLLMAMNSQLDANPQSLNRAQQDKAYTESLLAQQLAAWKSTQSSTNPQTLEQQLTTLQAQLLQLQARYTADHPDVIKTKSDIAEVKKRLAEVNSASAATTEGTDKASASEPPEIRQLRLQIHQYEGIIEQTSREQKRLQSQIQVYQGRMALSPGIEEQYKQLTRDYDTALKSYQDLLAKKGDSEMATDMERRQQGEQMRLLNQASLPDSPSFPNRWLFAGGGLGAGLFIGLGIAMWLELRDKSIRTEQDVVAALELPILVSVPWLTEEFNNGNGKNGYKRLGRAAANEAMDVHQNART